MEESLELYTCKPGPDSEFPGDPGFNITAPRSYNELATLMSVPGTLQIHYTSSHHASRAPVSVIKRDIMHRKGSIVRSPGCAGEDAIRHLLSRGTHREFGYGSLVVMLVYYFGGAVWAAGSAIASGLFVPMLLIGSCIGRIIGLMVIDFSAKQGWGSGDV